MKKIITRGGKRKGAGAKPLPEGERKLTILFYVKEKHADVFRKKVQAIADKLNAK